MFFPRIVVFLVAETGYQLLNGDPRSSLSMTQVLPQNNALESD